MRRLLTRILVGAVALVGVAALTPSNAEAGFATANATVDIVAAIAITKTGDLDFGAVIPAAGTDTVTAAVFEVSGNGNAIYIITLPASATVTSGANSMTVDKFKSNPLGTGTLDATGNDSFTVGATLNVGASQVAGTYTGTFSVSVDYN